MKKVYKPRVTGSFFCVNMLRRFSGIRIMVGCDVSDFISVDSSVNGNMDECRNCSFQMVRTCHKNNIVT